MRVSWWSFETLMWCCNASSYSFCLAAYARCCEMCSCWIDLFCSNGFLSLLSSRPVRLLNLINGSSSCDGEEKSSRFRWIEWKRQRIGSEATCETFSMSFWCPMLRQGLGRDLIHQKRDTESLHFRQRPMWAQTCATVSGYTVLWILMDSPGLGSWRAFALPTTRPDFFKSTAQFFFNWKLFGCR